MKEFSETLKLALKYSGLTQQEFADHLKISKQKVSHYINGRATPNNVNAFVPMAKILNVNPAWLAGFDVPMENFKLEEREIELLKNFKKLNEIGKEKAEEYVEDLTENDKYTRPDTNINLKEA